MGRLGVHPNIVAVLDLGQEDDGSPYMVTELMGGGDIEGVLEEAEENRLSLERTIEIGKAICEGLEFAHTRGIVHRDLKPGNVWLAEDGLAKMDPDDLAAMDSAIPHRVGRGDGRRGCPQPLRHRRP